MVGFWVRSPCEFCCEPTSGCFLAGRLSAPPQDWALHCGNPRAATRRAEFPGVSLGWHLRLLLRERACLMAAYQCRKLRRDLSGWWEDWNTMDDEDTYGDLGWMACGGEEYGLAFLRDFESFIVVGAAGAGRRGGGRPGLPRGGELGAVAPRRVACLKRCGWWLPACLPAAVAAVDLCWFRRRPTGTPPARSTSVRTARNSWRHGRTA